MTRETKPSDGTSPVEAGSADPEEPSERVDLQREADEERPWTIKSREDSDRLESFKQGELDRRGNPADRATDLADFYVERR